MVTAIVEEIGKQIKAKNPYFENYAVNAVQMPNGQILLNFYGEEPESSGISDCQGVAFYIRIEPKASVSKAPQRFTSEQQTYIAKQRAYLVAFAFESKEEIDSEKWVNKLANHLAGVKITEFPAARPRVELVETNAGHIENWFEETKKQFNVTKRFNLVRVSFDIIRTLSDEECNSCNISKTVC